MAEDAPAPYRAGHRPVVAHIVHRMDVGGMENGIVNLLNFMPAELYRHVVICLTDFTDFVRRIQRDDVALYALHKREGKDPATYLRLWRLLRELRPDIVHTRNLAALEGNLPAALAGVRCRVHGEHGWDVHDLDGRSRKYRLLRRVYRPLVQHYVPVSAHIEDYLREQIGVPGRRITRVYNGVDARRFRPPGEGRDPLPVAEFSRPDALVIGTVGRMHTVKDPLLLVRAFIALLTRRPQDRERLRLVLVGEGPLRREAEALLDAAGARELAWLPGSRDDVPEVLRGFDVFVLPSLAEGVSNTILEAMACARPVVATRVGGNPELVRDGETGFLVPRSDPQAMADALERYLDAPELAARHGAAGRRRVESEFSMQAMVSGYLDVYRGVTASAPVRPAPTRG